MDPGRLDLPVRLETPLTEERILKLKAGDSVLLSGYVFTARDAAHRRIQEALDANKSLPVELRGETIYYVGPTPSFGDHTIGSAGPTTALRMDSYTPGLYRLGLKATIGKGNRSEAVRNAIVETKSIYFAALGGTGALLSRKIRKAEIAAYPDLGTEAIYRLLLDDFPAIVICDAHGNDYYKQVQTRGGMQDGIQDSRH